MKAKFINRWEGLISLLWVVTVFFVILYLIRHEIVFEPLWLFDLVLLFGWWGVGLIFAISGLKRGGLVNRICALLSIIGLVLFVLGWFLPVERG